MCTCDCIVCACALRRGEAFDFGDASVCDSFGIALGDAFRDSFEMGLGDPFGDFPGFNAAWLSTRLSVFDACLRGAWKS